MSRFAVVGHVEWVDFLRVARVPIPGEIIEARESWSEAAGGGAVAAVQLAKLAGAATFFTALGDDDRGRRAGVQLRGHGVEVEAVILDRPQRRAVAFLDDRGERTIAMLGARLVPAERTICPGTASPRSTVSTSRAGITAALRAARAARTLVATPRARDALDRKRRDARRPRAQRERRGRAGRSERLGWSTLTVTTAGRAAGHTRATDGPARSSAPLPGPSSTPTAPATPSRPGSPSALGSGMDVDAALALAARCGAGNLTGADPTPDNPYSHGCDRSVRPADRDRARRSAGRRRRGRRRAPRVLGGGPRLLDGYAADEISPPAAGRC